MPFEICHLDLLLEVEVGVEVMRLMLFEIYLLNLLLKVEVEVKDLFILMNINTRICLHTWLMPFEICHLDLLLEVEVGVEVMSLMLLEIYLLNPLLKVEVEVKDLFILMNINTRICLHTWLMPFKICHLFKDRLLDQFQ
jgi:hypothetical protein